MDCKDWVHCNSCYKQPQPGRNDLSFILTSCGHLFCGECISQNRCSICQNTCSTVSLSKQLPNDVMVYFTSPLTMMEKFITQLERVRKFQHTQMDRLVKHKVSVMEQKANRKLLELQSLEKENDLLKTQIMARSNVTQMGHCSPMSITSPITSSCVPQYTSVPQIRTSNSTGEVMRGPSPKNHSKSFMQRMFTDSPSIQTHLQTHSQSSTQKSLEMQAPSQVHSQFSTQRSTGGTPSNIQLRIMNAAQGQKRVSMSPSPRNNNTLHKSNTTPIGPPRLCIRTPPIDGKIGVIPGSKEAQKMSSPGDLLSMSTKRGSTLMRQSPRSAGTPSIITPQRSSYTPSSQPYFAHVRGRAIFPPYTPVSTSSSSPSLRLWTPPSGRMGIPFGGARKTH